MSLSADQKKKLRDMIGSAFDRPQFEMFLGDFEPSIIKAVEDGTDEVFIRNVIDEIDRRGRTERFLEQLAVERPDRTDLVKLVSTMRIEVRSDISLDDPEIKALIAEWRTRLTGLVDNLTRLAVYKGLHDILHQLQISRVGYILTTIRDLATNESFRMMTETYRDTFCEHCARARDTATKLPEPECTDELEWIERLERIADDLTQAIAEQHDLAVKQCGIRIIGVLRSRPPLLNRHLVVIARGVPINELREALSELEGVVRMRFPQFAQRIHGLVETLRTIGPGFSDLISLHNRWQEADAAVWRTEDLVQQPSANAIEELRLLFPELARIITELSQDQADWAQRLRAEVTALGPLVNELSEPPLVDATGRAIRDFLTHARLRFFQIDNELSRQCDEVVRIGTPIRVILDGVSP